MNQKPRFSSDVAFNATVKQIQEAQGSRHAYSRMEQRGGWETEVTPDLKAFLAERDMFYFGTATAEGQPYIQYRGGPTGFLRAVDNRTLGFADFGGNQQFISWGNLTENPRAFIFLIDYENRRRIKIWGRARVIEDDRRLLDQLADPAYGATPERAILFEIEAWDMNCPQHIHVRVPAARVADTIARLNDRIAELETRLAQLSER